jgi:hypothetical protein
LKFFENAREAQDYREEFIVPRQFDFPSIASESSVIEEIEILPSTPRYAIYNVWSATDIPPGARAHLAINLLRP